MEGVKDRQSVVLGPITAKNMRVRISETKPDLPSSETSATVSYNGQKMLSELELRLRRDRPRPPQHYSTY
jgi:hypothetical protein